MIPNFVLKVFCSYLKKEPNKNQIIALLKTSAKSRINSCKLLFILVNIQ